MTIFTIVITIFYYGNMSVESTALGNSRQLYPNAIASPYAPAERIAMMSPRLVSGIRRSLQNTSEDSQIGPTTSYSSSALSEVRFSMR